MVKLNRLKHSDLVQAVYGQTVPPGEVRLWWIGQAGFVIKSSQALLVIDPYLSNFLAKKYAHRELKHKRMIAAPIEAHDLKELDFVLVTHRHSDHMDPETLPILAENNPNCLFITPRSEACWSSKIGISPQSRVDMNKGESFSFNGGSVSAIAAAHEDFCKNQKGEHHFLGYVIRIESLTLYHSGDCIPYPGLAQELKQQAVDIALLPVNGRDEYRKSRNILGNFTAEEAMDLCWKSGIPLLLGHHYGMFDFNTVNETAVKETFQKGLDGVRCMLVRLGLTYRLSSLTDSQ